MGTLLDSLTSLAAPAVGPIAQRLGETDATVSRGVQASLASVLGGLITRTKDPTSSGQIFDLIRSHPASTKLTADAQSMIGELAAGAPTSAATGTFLNTVFGGKTSAVGDLITRAAGFKNPSSGSSLLAMAAPLVLGFLGQKVRDNKLNVSGLSSLLGGERESILAATPLGLMHLVGNGAALHGSATNGKPFVIPSARKPRSSRWIWPAVGVAAIAVGVFVMLRSRAPAAIQAAAGEVSEAVGGVGAVVKRMLPSGVELNVSERGIESKLIAFIEDASRPVNDSTWFDFDRLNFASGSATILPESQEQLNNIVAVLKAYPNVRVKVGGYTDDVGGAAANARLSQRRADAVRRALISNGIPAQRLQAQGYGEQHPVADNSTEEGRARNRRIALRVTAK